MKLPTRHFILLLAFITNFTWSQVGDDTHKYSAQGQFQAPVPGEIPLNRFVLRWNEIDDKIFGVYSDSYFATTDVPVTGSVTTTGRTFTVNLLNLRSGVRSLDIVTPAVGIVTGNVSSTVNLKNSAGRTLGAYTVPLLLSSDPTADEVSDLADPAQTCVVGMGALTGFCGRYQGTVSTASDPSGRCDSSLNNSQLEMTDSGDFVLHVPYGIGDSYRHYIGSLNSQAPVSPEVDIRRIHCDQIPGAHFSPDRCVTLKLQGDFSNTAGVRTFKGTYTIEENTLETCTLNLNLTRS